MFQKDSLNQTKRFIPYLVILILLYSNVYYFLFHRNKEFKYYYNRLVFGLEDNIISDSGYLSLMHEYAWLNRKGNQDRAIVFVGDSITKNFIVNEYFDNKDLLNRGIPSDTTFGLLHRIESNINNLNVEKVFLLIGFNDIGFRDDKMIIDNFRKIFSLLKSEKVYVQSIFPVDSSFKGTNERITSLNKEIKSICESGRCDFLDLHKYFVDEKGGLRKELSMDGVHPNGDGYRLWAELIKDKI